MSGSRRRPAGRRRLWVFSVAIACIAAIGLWFVVQQTAGTQTEDRPPQVLAAEAAQARGDLPGALELLNACLRENPHGGPAHLALGRLCVATGEFDNARSHLEAATREMPGSAQAWSGLGDLLYTLSRYQEAEKARERAVDLKPKDVDYLLGLGRAYAANHKLDRAQATFRRALAIDPRNPNALFDLGSLLQASQPGPAGLKEAEGLLMQAVKLNSSRARAFYKLGQVELDLGRVSDSIANFKVAAGLAPDRWDSWFALAQAYRRAGDGPSADAALEQVKMVRASYVDLQRTEIRAAQLPRDPALKLKLARLYDAKGETEAAIDQYQACLQLDPGNPDARRELSSLTARTPTQNSQGQR